MTSESTSNTTFALGGAVTIEGGAVHLHDATALTSTHMDALVWEAVFAAEEGARNTARWLLWELGQIAGVRPASIHDLYMARGQGKCGGFTVPAINVRGMTYDTARSIFRTAKKLNAGAFILEIARSEIAYTEQRPAEYVSVMLAAALREGYRGPLFIQGDHFQVNHKKYAVDPVTEVNAVKAIVKRSGRGGLLQHRRRHIDARRPVQAHARASSSGSTTRCASTSRGSCAREEPQGVTISIGGEIGEVGTENCTPAELEAFMEGFNAYIGRAGARHGRTVQDLGAVGHFARWRRAGRRLDRRCGARSRHARDALQDGSRHVRHVGRGTARGVDAAGRRVQQFPAHGNGGDSPRDELPEHDVRSPAGRH